MKKKTIISALIIAMLSASLSGCSCAKPVTPVIVTPTEEPAKATNTPTVTVAPTATTAPTETPTPTATPVPTATSTPTPTDTPTPTAEPVWTETERIESTCVANGSVTYKDQYGNEKKEELPLADHTPGEPERTEPTVDAEGKITTKCSLCGAVLSEEVLAKLTPTPTSTPTATNTPKPTATNTPTPTSTNTPTPSVTLSFEESREKAQELMYKATTFEDRIEATSYLPTFSEEEFQRRRETLLAHRSTPEDFLETLFSLGGILHIEEGSHSDGKTLWLYTNKDGTTEWVKQVSFWLGGDNNCCSGNVTWTYDGPEGNTIIDISTLILG